MRKSHFKKLLIDFDASFEFQKLNCMMRGINFYLAFSKFFQMYLKVFKTLKIYKSACKEFENITRVEKKKMQKQSNRENL